MKFEVTATVEITDDAAFRHHGLETIGGQASPGSSWTLDVIEKEFMSVTIPGCRVYAGGIGRID